MEDNLDTQFQDEPEDIVDAPEEGGEEPETPEPEDGGEDHAPEREQRVEKPKISVKARINALTREKYQALEIAEQIRQENEALRQQMLQANHRSDFLEKASFSNYTESAQLRLEQAKQSYIQAIETGDATAQAELNAKIGEITAEMQSLKSWKAKDTWEKEQERTKAEYLATHQQQQQPYAPIQEQQPAYTPESQTWLQSNPWFADDSPEYNPELSERVQEYSDSLEQYYYNRGEGHKIGRGEYFNAINAHVRELTGATQRRNIPMRNSRIPVSPVRSNSGYMNRDSQRQKAPLPAEHQEMLRHWKIPEKDYRREYESDLQNRREIALQNGRV